jgi:mannose-6-phosphate isomerase-like protein (cupin superfamily)
MERTGAKWRFGPAMRPLHPWHIPTILDEYMIVVLGRYTLIINGEQIPIIAGEEYFIPHGTPHGGELLAGTRTIHAFGGHRADRVRK